MTELVECSEKGFRKLLVWQKAHQLVLLVYQLTQKFPKVETYALTSYCQKMTPCPFIPLALCPLFYA